MKCRWFSFILLGIGLSGYGQTALKVVGVSPEQNRLSVSTNALIRANFNLALDSSSVQSASVQVYSQKRGRLPGVIGYDSSNYQLIFTPQEPFSSGDEITAVLRRSIKSRSGHYLNNGFVWHFIVQTTGGANTFLTYYLFTGMENSTLASADFDGDGRTEAAVAGLASGKYSIKIAHLHERVFEPLSQLELPYAVRPLYVADLDANGRPDLIALHRNNGSFSICMTDSLGNLKLSKTYLMPDASISPRSAAVSDLNGDGALDVIIYGRLATLNDWAAIQVYLNNGSGQLGQNNKANYSFYKTSKAESILLADLNLDGFMDIGASTQSTGEAFGYFVNPGNGVDFPSLPTLISSLGGDLESSLAADFNADGVVDLITADINASQIMVSLNQLTSAGVPIFSRPALFSATPSTNSMEYGDIDMDGDLDVATLGNKLNVFTVLSNDGNGAFATLNEFTVPSKPRSFNMVDYNNDGSKDFLVVNQFDTLMIFQNKNTPNHAPAAPQLGGPVNGSFRSVPTARLAWTTPTDPDGDALHFRVELIRNASSTTVYDSRINPELFSPRPPVAPGQDSVVCLVTLSGDGQYRWRAQALDSWIAGQFSAEKSFILDRTAPILARIELSDSPYQNWINPEENGGETTVRLAYSELYPDSACMQLTVEGNPFYRTNLSGGSNQNAVFVLPVDFLDDGLHSLSAWMRDQAGNRATLSGQLKIDRTPPFATSIHSNKDTLNVTRIPLTILPGQDGAGSGLSGVYRVQVSVNDGPWQIWLDRTTARDTVFQGMHLTKFAFEVVAYDRVGNLEAWQNIPEATVFVDTTYGDVTPPEKPQLAKANGANPSPWTRESAFTITWQLPSDKSGIRQLFYKIGSAPSSASDLTAAASPQSPLQLQIQTEGVTPVYLWLSDGRNNIDFHKYALVLLRRDTESPVLQNPVLENAAYSDNQQRYWFNPQVGSISGRVGYAELHALRLEVFVPWLGRALTVSPIACGVTAQTTVAMPTTGAMENSYDLTFIIVDSTANEGQSVCRVAFDKTPPSGCRAAASAAMSVTERFTLSWSKGQDSGSGLAGLYDVYVRSDGGAWQKWLTDTETTLANFQGRHGHWYEFEAVNKDHVGNVEALLSSAETAVQIDTTADDVTAPSAPLDLRAGGSGPDSPWQMSPTFQITWITPFDESGVVKCRYKIGAAPVSPTDTTGSVAGAGPLNITLAQEGQQPVYVWLQDKMGNANHLNAGRVRLRYDKQAPVITMVKTVAPLAYYTDSSERAWYNPTTVAQCTLQIVFMESQPDSVFIGQTGLGPQLSLLPTSTGQEQTVTLPLTFFSKNDGRYTLHITCRDVAGRVDTTSYYLGLDSKPPEQISAFAPDTSSQTSFLVSWSKGVDQGSGVAGIYRIFAQENGSDWRIWLDETTKNNEWYNGQHGHVYRFEAIGLDHMGLMESSTGMAETTVLVDTTASDKTSPGPPLRLRTDRSMTNFWQNNNRFQILWDAPFDPSGLDSLFFKIGSMPSTNSDYSGKTAAVSPLTVFLEQEGAASVYLWLMDKRRNVDYRQAGVLVLGYDKTWPAWNSFTFSNPAYGTQWFNPAVTAQASARLRYTELHADSVAITCPALGLQRIFSDPKNGSKMELNLNIPLSGKGDGLFLIESTITDSATNRTMRYDSLWLDQSPPAGITASSATASGSRTFTVSWSAGSDAHGVGLAALYDVKVNDNNSGWQTWLTRFTSSSALFTGEQGHRYEFEAAGYDLLQNIESFSGRAECATTVDTTLYDQTPPGPPLYLTVQPSYWNALATFTLLWQNPADASGITAARYKLNAPPVANDDTTGSLNAIAPAVVRVPNDGEHVVYLWLGDGRGNMDYKKYANITLRYDASPPEIDSLYFASNTFLGRWLNPRSVTQVLLKIQYSEWHPDSLLIYTPYSTTPFAFVDIIPGNKKWLEAAMPLSGLADGCYSIPVVLSDKTGRTATDSLSLCLDATAPLNSYAVAPTTSISPEFEVAWNGAAAGSDADGSGLSGEYDVRMRIDNGPWYLWQEKVRRSTSRYIGVHGHRYAFEVAAWDNVGNREAFLNIPESTTMIDTAYVDYSAPDIPKNLTVNGASPSPWQKSPDFQLTWENPLDPGGIARVLYKFDHPPLSADDTSGTGAAVQPFKVRARVADGQKVFLWLMDGKGNVDFSKTAMMVLRYDHTAPVIDSLRCLSPALAPDWYNQKKTGKVSVLVYYTEAHPQQCVFSHALLPEPAQIKQAISSGRLETDLKVLNATDGLYKIQTTVGDSAGNISTAVVLQLHLDSTPPVVKHQAQESAINEKTETTIQAVIRDANRVESASIQFWPAGSRYRATVAMSAVNDSTFSGTIPTYAAQARGLEYAIWASDGLTLRREPALEAAPSSFSLRVRLVGANNSGMQRPSTVSAGQSVSAYRMVSFPLQLDDPSPQTVFTDDFNAYQKSKWRLFSWNTANSGFDEYPDIGKVEPGRSFWLITSMADLVLDSGPGTSVSVKQPFTITLQKGWNDVANPFAFNIDWRDVFSATGVDTQKIVGPYAWDGEWLLPFEVTLLKPWEGFSFYVNQQQAVLRIPAIETATTVQKEMEHQPYQQADWALAITAKVRDLVDSRNFIGVAAAGLYPVNYPEPYKTADFLSLYFFDDTSVPLTTAFRAPADGHIWNMAVATNQMHQPVKLNFNPITRWPENLSLALWDETDEVWVNLKSDSVYYYFSNADSVRRFQIYAGNAQFMSEHSRTGVRMTSELSYNYPNPFNQQTLISWYLAQEGVVELSIYNILGQKVRWRTLGFQSTGRKQWMWDGCEQNGQRASSGIYILHVDGPHFSVQRKMIFIQ
jgi:hypothetical protein